MIDTASGKALLPGRVMIRPVIPDPRPFATVEAVTLFLPFTLRIYCNNAPKFFCR
jgi:hypothetical protein